MTKMPDVTIPASDGVNLVGDVYLPGDGGRYPAVIDMEPYGRSMSTDYVDHGYARINTDVRGSGKSGGALCLLCLREQQDVYDVVEWAARQPWSNGHVALYGYSYSAITSLLGAALQPPHLDALVVDASTHHGTGQAGEVGAPYDDGSPPSFSSAPPAGEDVAWLDRFLKGRRNGIENRPRVRFLDLGDRTWHAAPSWDSATRGLTSVYLSAEKSGTALASPNDGTLASAVPTGRASYQDSYVYSPTAGASVPSGKEGPDAFAPYVPLDQTIDQPSGLTYTSTALSAPLRLAGPSELRFWAVTEASDMAWVARLIDVAPNGSQQIITQGSLRGSFP